MKSIPELRQLVKQHKMAVTVEMMQHGALSYQSFIDKESSKYYMIMKQPMYWEYTIVMASKTWPFMEQLNRIVLMQQESGIRYYLEYSVIIFVLNILIGTPVIFCAILVSHQNNGLRYSKKS